MTPYQHPVSDADGMTVVPVSLGSRSYEVRIKAGLLHEAGSQIAPFLRRPRVAILTDQNVAPLHLQALEAALAKAGIASSALVLPAGEGTKGWAGLQQAVEWLLDEKIERNDMVIALGGGVIGDLAGFASAILRRGVRLIQIPTTLLAQVDSSVGGKTGINTRHGKNLVGAFHQSSLVLIDPQVLSTLPARDFRAGYGEVAKYGLLGDAAFFAWLEENALAMRDDPVALAGAVARSVAMKAAIVARDETETGERALLNLGHSFGHALEAATGYSNRLLHGEAVALGCVLAFDLSARLGLCPQEAPSQVAAHFARMGLPVRLADVEGGLPDAPSLMELMAQDKKVVDGRLRLILADSVGNAFQSEGVDPQAVLATLAGG